MAHFSQQQRDFVASLAGKALEHPAPMANTVPRFDLAPLTPPPEDESEGLQPVLPAADRHKRTDEPGAAVQEKPFWLAIEALAAADELANQTEAPTNGSNRGDEDLQVREHRRTESGFGDSASKLTWFDETAYRQPVASNTRTSEDARVTLHHDTPLAPPQQPLPFAKAPLPTLPRYVDHILKKFRSSYNNPPYGFEFCPVCDCQFTPELIEQVGDYIPLTCSHWVHYRCWLHHVSRSYPQHDSCPVCNERLFQWEGLTANMICARENIDMETSQLAGAGYIDQATKQPVNDEHDQYANDCAFIEGVLARFFDSEALRLLNARPNAPPLSVAHSLPPQNVATIYLTTELTRQQRIENEHPNPTDSSPNLTKVLIDSINYILNQNCPRSRLLSYESDLGSVLFAHLVWIKFERWLFENTWDIVRNTEGWWKFKEHGLRMQSKMTKMIFGSD
ncbi:hypothetical protein BDV96DRAFT_201388 [Lophiotrema nucula]|uniref:RING-type domain-containing protein n=1 Tax=Lophiotrema nucula TaxID=690887 RepID=A0A6A5YTC2_9PLEO|nr:hypothetical protein BDV96DRAFT_201388 [Lophiotrema nucula]